LSRQRKQQQIIPAHFASRLIDPPHAFRLAHITSSTSRQRASVVSAMATAGHLGIATPRSDGGPSELSINPDDISFGSQEASFKSPSKLNKENQPPKHPQSFLNRLQKPTGSTPLSEIKNPQNPIVRPPVRASNEFTPMLKSASQNRLRKAMGQPTPSRLRNSNLPQMMEEEEDSVMVEGETGVEVSTANLQNEEKLADMSSVSASFQKLPSRSPGSNDGAALLTLREQEKVSRYASEANAGHR
jgi:hypothetical protein